MGLFDIFSDILGTKNQTQVRTPTNQFKAVSPAAPGTVAAANAQATGAGGPAQDTIQRQSALSDQLTAASRGEGPNPALEQLKQTTSANVNRAAGTAASMRGVNPALAARMAVDTGAGANQEAAGQAATLSAQQQIAARGQLGQNLAQTGGMQLGQQSTGIQALGTAGGLDLGAQGMNEQVAAQNAGLDLGAQQLQAGVAAQNTGINAGLAGGVLNAAGAIPFMDEGGEVPGPLHSYLDELHGAAPTPFQQFSQPVPELGGPSPMPNSPALPGAAAGDPAEKKKQPPQFFDPSATGVADFQRMTARPVHGAIYAHGGSIYSDPSYADGGRVPALVSPQEQVLPPRVAHDPTRVKNFIASGKGRVPGTAKAAGDTPRNDTVRAKLQSGSVVVPRSITQGPDAPARAATFVASVLRRSGGGPVWAMGGGQVESQEKAPGIGSRMKRMPDYAEGGYVEAPHNALMSKKPKTVTARGAGRNETKRRITKSKGNKPRYKEA
jgi:hypothetical protein